MTQRDSLKTKRRGLRRSLRTDHATSRSTRVWLRRPCLSICKPWMPQADQMLIKRSTNEKSTLCCQWTNSRSRTCLVATLLNRQETNRLLSSPCSFPRWLKRAASTCPQSALGADLVSPSSTEAWASLMHSEANPSWHSLKINSRSKPSKIWR